MPCILCAAADVLTLTDSQTAVDQCDLLYSSVCVDHAQCKLCLEENHLQEQFIGTLHHELFLPGIPRTILKLYASNDECILFQLITCVTNTGSRNKTFQLPSCEV